MMRRRVTVIVPTKFTDDDEIVKGFGISSRYLVVKYKISRVCKHCGLKANTVGDLEKFVANKCSRFGHENLCTKCAKQRRIERNKPRRSIPLNSLKRKTTVDDAIAFAARRSS